MFDVFETFLFELFSKQLLETFLFGFGSRQGLETFLVGFLSRQLLETFLVGFVSRQGLETFLIGFLSRQGLETFLIGFVSRQGLETFLVEFVSKQKTVEPSGLTQLLVAIVQMSQELLSVALFAHISIIIVSRAALFIFALLISFTVFQLFTALSTACVLCFE